MSTTRDLIEAFTHEICDWSPGQILVRQGHYSDSLYLVVRGRLQVWQERAAVTQLVDVICPGELVSELGLLVPGPATATVRAPGYVRGLRLSHDALLAQWEDTPLIARELHGRALLAAMTRLREASCASTITQHAGGDTWTRAAA